MRRGAIGRAVRGAVVSAAVVSAAVVSAAALGGATGSAAAGAGTADACGYFVRGTDAYYNHCTSSGIDVVIRMDLVGEPDRDRCVPAGETLLGPASTYRGAYSTGKLC